MFEQILGHKNIICNLENDINSNTISHSYVFYGRNGIGKKLVAFEFAKLLLNTSNLKSCADFKYITKDEEKQSILVEQIREEIIEDVYIAPATSNYKVYVIDNADEMNISAQNTLLKTLEEPPQSVVIILVTGNIDKLIGTILSRTTNIFFELLDDLSMKKYIEMNNIEASDSMVRFSQGSIAALIELTNENQKFSAFNDIIKCIEKKDVINLMELLKIVNFKKQLDVEYLEFLLLNSNMYDKISFIEEAKKNILLNANEDMQKTKLVIDLIK